MNTPVSLVIPTLNEGASLPKLIRGLDETLSRCATDTIRELVFVDDGSTDGTVDYIADLQSTATRYSVRLISRQIRHGPAHAELAGIRQASHGLVLKMDGDGQHDVRLLPRMLEASAPDVDIVVASRYVPDGRNDWSPVRGVISRGARFLARRLIPGARLVEDPVSGYFLVKRDLVLSLDPHVPYYKLLLYLLATHPNASVREVPVVMGQRADGRSKIVGTSPKYVREFLTELLSYWRLSRRALGAKRETRARHGRRNRGSRSSAHPDGEGRQRAAPPASAVAEPGGIPQDLPGG